MNKGGSHYVENLLYYDIDHNLNKVSCWRCYVYVFVTTVPFETEDKWINDTKHRQQSQPEVIFETRDVST